MILADLAVPAATATSGTSAALLALIGGSGVALGAIISAVTTFLGNRSQQNAARALAEWQVEQNRWDAQNLEGRTATATFLADVNEFLTSLTEEAHAYDADKLAKAARSYVQVLMLTSLGVRTTAENCYTSVLVLARLYSGGERDLQLVKLAVSNANSNLHKLAEIVRVEMGIDASPLPEKP